MRGNMRLDRKGKYIIHIFIVLCTYGIIYFLCKLDVKGYVEPCNDIEELLCSVSGFTVTEFPLDVKGAMIKWMLALSVVYILVGREIYSQMNDLKYIAMIRYGSYRNFYRSLMNKTSITSLLYGICGVGITYVLYLCSGNGQVSNRDFLEMSVIYVLQLLLLCLIQTVCFISFSGYTVSVIVLILWFMVAMCGHFVVGENWNWLPTNWGMYIRSAKRIDGGVTNAAYGIQSIACVLLWIGTPFIIKRKR